MSDDIAIVPLATRHLEPVVAIEEQLFDSPWSRAMFEQEVEERHITRSVVAVSGNRVVAYMIAWFVQEEAHLLNIGVDPAFQRRGIARRLVAHLIERAREENRTIVVLEVRVSNEPALALYQEFGFHRIGYRRRYYADTGEDAAVMTLRIDSPVDPDA